jgi:SAM-dependent MidA family methyltransferase
LSELRDLLEEEIRRTGPVSFARFMELALYHPELGYYASGNERTGWRGHFVTSPELHPAFGGLWAHGVEQIWEACGSPEEFTLIEVGPGEGSLAEALLESTSGALEAALRYELVEPVPALRSRQRSRLERFERVGWTPSLVDSARCAHGCVLMNEVLDNQPVHLVETRDAAVVELFVASSNGDLKLVPGTPGEALARSLQRWPAPAEGSRQEISLAAERLVERAAQTLASGAVIVVDYGLGEEALRARPGGTLVSYGAGGADDRVLEDPGLRDISAHVRWDRIRAVLDDAGFQTEAPRSQRAVLTALGARDLELALAERTREAGTAGRGAAMVRTLSDRQALAALLDPSGLGGLDVMVATAGMAVPQFARAEDRPSAGPR